MTTSPTGCGDKSGATPPAMPERAGDREAKNCQTCANWRENPEQCFDCNRNPGNVDRWRPVGSAGFTRDAGKPDNPQIPGGQNQANAAKGGAATTTTPGAISRREAVSSRPTPIECPSGRYTRENRGGRHLSVAIDERTQ